MWIDLPDVIIREILTYIDLKNYQQRFTRINNLKKQLLTWKPEYSSIIHNYSPFYFSFQWIDLKNNIYEQELAMRIIYDKKLNVCNVLLKRLNETYSRKYYKQQSSFTNLYGITFTKEEFNTRYYKMNNRYDYGYNSNILTKLDLMYGCVNWKGEDPSSWFWD